MQTQRITTSYALRRIDGSVFSVAVSSKIFCQNRPIKTKLTNMVVCGQHFHRNTSQWKIIFLKDNRLRVHDHMSWKISITPFYRQPYFVKILFYEAKILDIWERQQQFGDPSDGLAQSTAWVFFSGLVFYTVTQIRGLIHTSSYMLEDFFFEK